ncbi:MAG: hypothetical protein VSS75_020220 [Candidatus Parabeggiatoa sp.]|nr:hypothetical protein [Candidatus Parabeggiatoa sp.]
MTKLVAKGIKGIFVFAPHNNLVLLSYPTTLDFKLISNTLSRLNLRAFKQSGLGKMESGFFQLSDGFLSLHILEQGFHRPIILSFVCDKTLMKKIESYLPTFKKKLAILFG